MSISTSKKSGTGKIGQTGKLPNTHAYRKAVRDNDLQLEPLAVSKHGTISKPYADMRDAFARAYAVKRNATLAAIDAGYSPHTAKQQGSRLLSNVDLLKKIERYGQLGIDTLAEIAHDNTYNELARVNAAKALSERAYGLAKNSDKQAVGNITINYNRIHVDSNNDKQLPPPDHPTTPVIDGTVVPAD